MAENIFISFCVSVAAGLVANYIYARFVSRDK